MKDRSLQARLVISSPDQSPREEMIFDGASIGSAAENSLRVNGAGVGPYHLLIEKRKDGFWARELNWAQDTAINGAPLDGERRLEDGDRLLLGGDTRIEFQLAVEVTMHETSERRTAASHRGGSASKATGASSGRTLKLMLGFIVGILVVMVTVAVASRLGLKQIARVASPTPTPTPGTPDRGYVRIDSEQLRKMLDEFASNVARGHQFDELLMEEIGQRASQYTIEEVQPVWEQRHAICLAFSDLKLPPEFGVALALSRSRLQGEDVETRSFWRLPRRELRELLGEESLLDQPARASEIAQSYAKKLGEGLPHKEHDFLYVVACFGMNVEDARRNVGYPLSAMTENYHDFRLTMEGLAGALPSGASDRVIDFLAAGLVAYFPDKFNPNLQSFADPCGGLSPL